MYVDYMMNRYNVHQRGAPLILDKCSDALTLRAHRIVLFSCPLAGRVRYQRATQTVLTKTITCLYKAREVVHSTNKEPTEGRGTKEIILLLLCLDDLGEGTRMYYNRGTSEVITAGTESRLTPARMACTIGCG